MGRGIIKANIGEGLYQVEVDLDTARIVRRQEELQRQLDQLDIDITAQENTVADLEDAWQADPDDAETLAELLSARAELAHMHARRAAARSALENLQGANTQDPTFHLWCADYTTDLSVGKYVGVAEIPGELRFGNIRPAYDGRADYTQARDGVMNPALNLPPASAVLYWALRPSWQRYHPTYRYGTITAVDTEADIASVDLAPMSSSDQLVDVNYQAGLSDIPVFYMDCNAAVFEIGDEVLVEFPNLSWESARVAGFRRNPKPCRIASYIRFQINGTPVDVELSQARIMDAETGRFITPEGADYPEMWVQNGLLDISEMHLNGNQYVDFSAWRYSTNPDGSIVRGSVKLWFHNVEVFPQFVKIHNGISSLTSDTLAGAATNTTPNADLPDLTPEDAGRIVRVFCSEFTNPFRVHSKYLAPGEMRAFIWTGSAWETHGYREPNIIQERSVYEGSGHLTEFCSAVSSPSVTLVDYGYSHFYLSAPSGRTTAQVNWILNETLLADAVITEEEINGEIATVATLDYVGMIIWRQTSRSLTCDTSDTTLWEEAPIAIYEEDPYLGYTSRAAGLTERPTPEAWTGQNGWYEFGAYCDPDPDISCFGWYVSSHTLDLNGIENLVILSDSLGRNPTYAAASVDIGVVYGINGDPDTYNWVAPKQRISYFMGEL